MPGSDPLALGLDEIIRINRTTNRRGGGGRGGIRGRGGRGGANGFRARGGGGIPRTSNAPAAGRWKNDLYGENYNQFRGEQRTAGVNSTTKLLISNLDHGVTTNDIQELFEDVGAVRAAHVHYDETGRSLGTAEVIYERRVDAIGAQQKYNTLNLDGRPMDIKLVGGIGNGGQVNHFTSANGNGGRNQRSGFRNNNNNQRNNNSQNLGRTNRTRGGKQQQNGEKDDVTTDDLDAELDAYRAESKQKKLRD